MRDFASSPTTTTTGQSWKTASSLLAICAATVGLAFHHDILAVFTLWVDFTTYNYCFLIAPISLYLIWRQRLVLAELPPAPSTVGVAVGLACLTLWWVADVALVGELRQLALVGLLQGIVWAILGGEVYRHLRFPLLYLFLMVPTGTVLLPPMQLAATRLATSMLDLTGVPVFTEGVVIEVPTGTYTVAPGCAGLNFLLVAVALSLLYARYTYGRAGKRIACVAAALVIAILANGVRIFGIIWLAEISHRHIDIISDHLLYGWAFFSLIIVASMAVGNLFADPLSDPSATAATIAPPPAEADPRTSTAAALAIIAAVAVAVGQSALTKAPLPANAEIALDLPNALGGWRKASPDARWHPSFAQADLALRTAYAKDGRQVEVLMAYYWPQREGHKATAVNNTFADPADGIAIDDGPAMAAAGIARLEISTLRVEGSQRRLLVGYWYWIGGWQAAKPLPARLFALPAHLAGDDRAAVVTLAVDGADMAGAHATLADFLLNRDALAEALDAASLRARAPSSTLR